MPDNIESTNIRIAMKDGRIFIGHCIGRQTFFGKAHLIIENATVMKGGTVIGHMPEVKLLCTDIKEGTGVDL